MPRAVMKSPPTSRPAALETCPRVATTLLSCAARFTDGDGGRERGSSRSPSLLCVARCSGCQQINRIEMCERSREKRRRRTHIESVPQ